MLRLMRRRLDMELVRRGLAESRSEAADAIRAGIVTVAGYPARTAGTLVAPDEPVSLTAASRRFVSRGGDKLDAALDRFALDVSGRLALDAGASTGGFTDVLVRRGAAHVIAVDVGYGQLDWSLRDDVRVTVLERTNVRNLRSDQLAYRPNLITADLSFISLRTVLPALIGVAEDVLDAILLVKPQFESAREDVASGGVVRDPEVWSRAIVRVAGACGELQLAMVGVMASPVIGPAGNVEFLVHAARPGHPAPGTLDPMVAAAVAEGIELSAARG
jgi:23S rRNA (cytidine1920-2'-O)/16S rRNA (cytidine1409-2'-O)-methyltransferase